MKQADDRHSQRLHSRLVSNKAAIQAVQVQLGLDPQLIERFRLGLSEPYPKSSSSALEAIHQDALVAPVLGADGRFYSRYVYRNLVSITTDNRIDPPETWTAGASESYYSRKCEREESLIVCDSITDLWALVAVMKGSSLERTHVLVAPTRRREWPEAWKSKGFWKPWQRINIAFAFAHLHECAAPNGDKGARDLARIMDRPVYRLLPHDAPSWLASHVQGLRHDELHRLLKNATLLRPEDLRSDETAKFSSATSEDLSCSYQRGYLFEALQVLEHEDAEGRRVERFRTVVVRSDRTLHRIETMPSPPGTPKSERVIRLMPDGALLRRVPTPSTDATWRWNSVQSYIDRRDEPPPLAAQLGQILGHLRASAWLPFKSDYLILAFVVAATYCQQIFDAVPLILVTGPKHSGKTELTIAVSRLCANSPGPIGLISPATLSRLIDASHGFVAIDDLEKVISKRANDPYFGDLVQTLKLSYKKESAQRMLTDVNQNNQLQRLNFFGIKLINNTRGVDEILGSRMLTIATRQMPPGESLARDGRLNSDQCAQLRDHLHVWAFSHVEEIARTYAEICPNISTRDEEIFAPLQVLARLSGVDAFVRQVDESLGTIRRAPHASAVDAMEEALVTILANSIQGGRGLQAVVTVLEVQMRMQLQQGRNFGKSFTTEVGDIESPEWIGRQFKDVFAAIGATPLRLEMYGRGTRAWQLSEDLKSKAILAASSKLEELCEVSDPRAFCIACSTCDYQEICEMRSRKQKADSVHKAQGRSKEDGRAENTAGSESGLH